MAVGTLARVGQASEADGWPPKALAPLLEPFVSADEAARFLAVKRRHLLTLARKGIAGAYGLGTGNKRKLWVFHLSKLAGAITGETATMVARPPKGVTILSGSPR
jgi:hypothetical protein